MDDESDHIKELMMQMFASRDKALDIATNTLNFRLNGMNEFRDQLREQASRFITRQEHDALIAVTHADIQTLHTMLDNNSAKIADGTTRMAAIETKIYLGGAGIVIIVSILQLLLNVWHHL